MKTHFLVRCDWMLNGTCVRFSFVSMMSGKTPFIPLEGTISCVRSLIWSSLPVVRNASRSSCCIWHLPWYIYSSTNSSCFFEIPCKNTIGLLLWMFKRSLLNNELHEPSTILWTDIWKLSSVARVTSAKSLSVHNLEKVSLHLLSWLGKGSNNQNGN